MPDENGDRIPSAADIDPKENASPLQPVEQDQFDELVESYGKTPAADLSDQTGTPSHIQVDPDDEKRKINFHEDDDWGTPPHQK